MSVTWESRNREGLYLLHGGPGPLSRLLGWIRGRDVPTMPRPDEVRGGLSARFPGGQVPEQHARLCDFSRSFGRMIVLFNAP
jgi:hypothetical protein